MNAVQTQQQKAHDFIDELEEAVMRRAEPVYTPITHRFTTGMYSREMFIPGGTMVTSKIHKIQHQLVMLTGTLAIVDVHGNKDILRAPQVIITEPGTRRIVWALEDTKLIAFYPTSETDIEKIEELLIEPHTDHLGLDEQELRDLKAFQGCLNISAEDYFSNRLPPTTEAKSL